ncbi:undecaprenyl-diphosphatase UppP [Candidatus Parcubacteria bacterium]|nr:undecaprenyl-diphosphatase UppP [Candidatus Parcubacteria bacterium]
MEIIQSIILGFVQGLAEFLPISSSAHLILSSRLFNWQDQGLSFDVALHLGTLIAVLVYFRKDWYDIIVNSYLVKNLRSLKFKTKELKLDIFFIIIAATIPGVFAGLVLNDYATNIFRNPALIAMTLSIGALLLFYSDRVGIKKENFTALTLKAGIVIGLFQALAIIPGVSRSGITITAALLLGLSRTASARFSFLLSTPIILGAGIMEFPNLIKEGIDISILIGIMTAAISGYLAIKYMIRYVENRSYNIFVGYRIVLAIFILFFLL